MTQRRRAPDVLLSELPDGSGVVVHLGKRAYYPLSASGVVLWRLYDAGPVDDDELVAALVRSTAVAAARAAEDVASFVARLVDEGILLDA